MRRRKNTEGKLKVFISYAHKNTAQRIALEAALTDRDHEVRHDVGLDHFSPDLHKAISANINWADVVVPILTPAWLQSHECRDEIVRANERRKQIVCFRHADVKDDGPPRVPFFMRDSLALYKKWCDDSVEDDAKALVASLEKMDLQRWKSSLYEPIREMGDYIQRNHGDAQWKLDLCRHLLEEQRRHLETVLTTKRSRFDVSHENSYLAFAEPIFRNADTIIAICIASISTFWTNPDFRPRAGIYLGSQRRAARSIRRLFVFRDPEELVSYKNVLQSHYLSYGKKGADNAVLLCTLVDYGNLLRSWGSPQSENVLREDFGLLTFSDSGEHMHATLNSIAFAYNSFDPRGTSFDNSRHRIVEEVFDRLSKLSEGDMDDQTRVLRWAPCYWEDEEALAQMLEVLFKDKLTPIHHYVVLRPDAGRGISGILSRIATAFEKQKEALRIVSVDLARRCNVLAIDGRYQSRLRVRDDFEYILHVEFENEDALKHYYAHQVHSLEREILYGALSADAEQAFAQMARDKDLTTDQRTEKFAKIEAGIVDGGYIVRFDVRDHAPSAALVMRAGAPFGGLTR